MAEKKIDSSEFSGLLHQFPFLLGKRRITADSAADEGIPRTPPSLTPIRQRVIRNFQLSRRLLHANLVGQLDRLLLKSPVTLAQFKYPVILSLGLSHFGGLRYTHSCYLSKT